MSQAASQDSSSPVLAINNLQYSWRSLSPPLLDIPELYVTAGQSLFLQGPSGSGKSTLLNLIAGVLLPQKGTINLLNRPVNKLSGPQRDRLRANHIGFIFQMFNLIPYLSVLENVTLPCRFSPQRRLKAQQQSGTPNAEALRLLKHLDMASPELLGRPVGSLSVGQQQRVAAARALMGAPELLVADEPTSALDSDRRQAFIELLFSECQRSQTTLLFVSHDTSLAPLFDTTVSLAELNHSALTPSI